MQLVSDKAVRKQISKVFRTYLTELSDGSEKKYTLKELDELSGVLSEQRKEANGQVAVYHQQELSIAYLSILALTVTCLTVNQENGSEPPIPKDWIDDKGVPDPNFVLQNLLLQITNYSLAVVRLIEDGLDNAARCVLRSLIELSCQFLVLSSDRSSLVAYVKDVIPDEAKQIWYELFAKKGRLRKKLASLEATLGLPVVLAAELSSYREEMTSIHSEAVHHSSTSTIIGAYAGDFENKEFLHLALLGKASTASRLTLETLNTVLTYTLLMFVNVLIKVHGFRAQVEDTPWRHTFMLIECVRKIVAVRDNDKNSS